MTSDDMFGRDLSRWLQQEGEHRVPDHLAEVLVETAAIHQRRWWSSPERWLPMDLSTRRLIPFGQRDLLRPVVLLVILALLVTTLVIVAVGSQPAPLAPFGIARSGTHIVSQDGDLYRFDPASGATSLLIGGAPFDFGPLFAHDGKRFAFLRGGVAPAQASELTLMISDADGGNLHALTAPGPDWLDWSPDDRQLALMAHNDLYVVDADGATPARKLPIPGRIHFPTWLPPDGKEILVRLENQAPSILAIRPDGTGLRTVSTRPAINDSDYGALAVSPDGTRVSFDQWSRPTPQDDPIPRVFVLDLATRKEAPLPAPEGTGQQATAVFSPDGLMIAYARTYPDGTYQAVVAPADGSSVGRALGPRQTIGRGIGLTKAFTPDGTALIARYGSDDAGTMYLLPLDGSAATKLDSGAFDFLDIQRLAP